MLQSISRVLSIVAGIFLYRADVISDIAEVTGVKRAICRWTISQLKKMHTVTDTLHCAVSEALYISALKEYS